jgi:hemolysin activation/secretion protein
MPSKQIQAIALLCATLEAGAALAQQVPNVGDALRQAQPPAQPRPPAPALPPLGGAGQPIEPPMTALPAGPKVAVAKVEVIGNRVVSTATLLALVAAANGKELSLAELEGFAQRITKYYRAHGYFVARAYIPAQEMVAGVVKIRVVEGNYGQFHLKNRSRVRDRIVQGMLDDVKGTNIVSVDTLERAMLIINDTPGVQVTRADVMPGEKVGTSDFAIETTGKAPFAGYVMLDNYGSVYTGKDRLSFNLDANSPSGSGDRLSLGGLTTEHGDLWSGRVGYSAPLAPNGLRGELTAGQTAYRLVDTYAPLDATGHATTVDADISYPIRRTEAQTVSTSTGLEYQSLIDDVGATATRNPRTAVAATASLSLRDARSIFGLDGLTQASGAVTVGHLRFKDSAAEALDAAGADTQGTYSKLVASLSRATLLPEHFALNTTVSGQYALDRKSLDGTERMAVSGPNAVVAYPPDELIGDSAVLAHLDIDHPMLQAAAFQVDGLVFGDYGEAWQNYATPGFAAARHLADIGMGLNASAHGMVLHASLAHRISAEHPLSEPYARNKLLVQGGWVF